MVTIAEALDAAVKSHQAGNLAEAERIYREILKLDQRHADAWHLLGLVDYARANHAQALEHITRAIQLDPQPASFHNHLAEAYLALGQPQQAEAGCRAALERDPNSAIFHNTLGNVLGALSRHPEALASYRRALELQPDFAQAHYNLALALERSGDSAGAEAGLRKAIALKAGYRQALRHLGMLLERLARCDEALSLYRQAVALDPDDVDVLVRMGNIFKEQNLLNDATASYQHVLDVNPRHAEAHFYLGVIQQRLKHVDLAEHHYREALNANPNSPETLNNLGTLYRREGRLAQAIEVLQRALEVRPNFAEALNNLGTVFMAQGRRAEAMVCYDQVLRTQPDNARAHSNRSLALLGTGHYEEGWLEMEWRWKMPDFPSHGHQAPEWDGSPLGDRTLLVHFEQGLGDTLQFIRYLPLVAARGGKMIVEVQKSLVPILTQSGFQNVVAKGTPLARHDLRIATMSLPRIFGTTLDTIPSDIPYLSPDPKLVDHWRGALGQRDKFRVGIVWKGSSVLTSDVFRSIPLAMFAPLAIADVELVSLQKGEGREQLTAGNVSFAVRDFDAQLDVQHGPFMDTAAAMKNLDLVVSCDTATAHLAGGLGVPVWLALPVACDWRWQYEGDYTPWYPTMRLFRQRELGDWQPVFAEMAEALRQTLAGRPK